jgi:hypothetical protein
MSYRVQTNKIDVAWPTSSNIAERVEAEILYHKNEVRGEEDILRIRILQQIESCSEIASND